MSEICSFEPSTLGFPERCPGGTLTYQQCEALIERFIIALEDYQAELTMDQWNDLGCAYAWIGDYRQAKIAFTAGIQIGGTGDVPERLQSNLRLAEELSQGSVIPGDIPFTDGPDDLGGGPPPPHIPLTTDQALAAAEEVEAQREGHTGEFDVGPGESTSDVRFTEGAPDEAVAEGTGAEHGEALPGGWAGEAAGAQSDTGESGSSSGSGDEGVRWDDSGSSSGSSGGYGSSGEQGGFA